MHHSNFFFGGGQKNVGDAEKHTSTWLYARVPPDLDPKAGNTPDVVYPTVYGHRHQQLQVQPQGEEGVGLLVADVVDHAGLVQLRLQLVPQISRNYGGTTFRARGPFPDGAPAFSAGGSPSLCMA